MPILGMIDSGKSGHLSGPGYQSIATITLASVASTANFTGISTGGYTDLQIRGFARSTSSATDFLWINFNGDTGSNYTFIDYYFGGGVGPSSGITQPTIRSVHLPISTSVANTYASFTIEMQDVNATKIRTARSYGGYAGTASGDGWIDNSVGAWNNTSKITSIQLTCASSGNFAAGSTFALYGIKAAA